MVLSYSTFLCQESGFLYFTMGPDCHNLSAFLRKASLERCAPGEGSRTDLVCLACLLRLTIFIRRILFDWVLI